MSEQEMPEAPVAEAIEPAGLDLGPTAIDAEGPVGLLAFAVMRRHFASFLKHEPGTREGTDSEELHDMRVASRRLRAALSLFAGYLPKRSDSFRRRFGAAGRALGEVRDLDVLLERLAAWREGLEPAEALALEGYVDVVGARRDRARRRMLRLLDSRGYARLVTSFEIFLRRGPARRGPRARTPALAVAPVLILKRFRRVRRLGDVLGPDSSPQDFHAMRILCKRLRYALEFHSELYGDEARAVIETLVALQDVLGLHQDAQVAIAELRSAAGSGRRAMPPRALVAAGRLLERCEREAAEQRHRFPKLYRRLRGKRFRKLRDTMEALAPAPAPGAATPPPEAPPALP